MNIEWAIGIAVSIVCGLIAVIYLAGQNRDDKQDARFDKHDAKFERNEEAFRSHSREDAAIHERVVRVETKVESQEKEVGKLRDMRHEIIEENSRSIAQWYASVIERVTKMIMEMRK